MGIFNSYVLINLICHTICVFCVLWCVQGLIRNCKSVCDFQTCEIQSNLWERADRTSVRQTYQSLGALKPFSRQAFSTASNFKIIWMVRKKSHTVPYTSLLIWHVSRSKVLIDFRAQSESIWLLLSIRSSWEERYQTLGQKARTVDRIWRSWCFLEHSIRINVPNTSPVEQYIQWYMQNICVHDISPCSFVMYLCHHCECVYVVGHEVNIPHQWVKLACIPRTARDTFCSCTLPSWVTSDVFQRISFQSLSLYKVFSCCAKCPCSKHVELSMPKYFVAQTGLYYIHKETESCEWV